MENQNNRTNNKVGVSEKAILIRDDGKFLAMRRTKTAPTRPLGWDLPGGELEFGEDPQEGIIREIKEEAGVEVGDLKIFDAVSDIGGDGEFWVTIFYTARPLSTSIVLSYEHDNIKWVTSDDFLELPGISSKQKRAIQKFKRL